MWEWLGSWCGAGQKRGGGRGWGWGPGTALTHCRKEQHRDPRARPYSGPCCNGGRCASPRCGGRRASSSKWLPPFLMGTGGPQGPLPCPASLPPQSPEPLPPSKGQAFGLLGNAGGIGEALPGHPISDAPASPLLGEAGPSRSTVLFCGLPAGEISREQPFSCEAPRSRARGATGEQEAGGVGGGACGAPGPGRAETRLGLRE